ncbi:MAG: HIRAN domain-containing protein [Synechococcaceae cyanobacterium]|nr:HIRAN domain-containing protein [Synechococcaceae cyanobacterium]
MAPKDNLFRRLQHLDQAGSSERRAARRRRQQQSRGEILQTFLAYKLDHAAEKMALGIAIGDPLTLLHEPTNQWDPNAVKVFWREQWIGYVPRDMAALIAEDVPEAATGLAAVVTGLTTTSQRDAFRLQISIPIPKASRRLRELGVTSSVAWDFDRTSGPDKMRLVINCTETAFRELQELLGASYAVGKCGYSYYPAQDGRHYPWYLSLTETGGRAPEHPEEVEQLVRSLFGVPSESTRVRERQERLKELEEKQDDINKRLDTSRAEERRLRREYDANRTAWERRADQALQQGEEAIELARSVEGELQQELDLKDQELQLALAENKSLEDQLEQIGNELDALKLQLDYLEQMGLSPAAAEVSLIPTSAGSGGTSHEAMAERLLLGLRSLAGRERLKPRQCLELVSEDLCPGHLLVLDSAWSSADQARGFEYGDQLFELLWLLATRYREQKLAGAPDRIAGQVFGSNSYAARESQTIEHNARARRERTFRYGQKTVEMWQHLKIGAKDSENRTLRIHFLWDEELTQVVIGHCGRHLFNPNH